MGPSVFLSSGDGYVGEVLELHQGCQRTFRGVRGKVGFLSSRHSGKGLPGSSPGGYRLIQRGDGVGEENFIYKYKERLGKNSVVGKFSGERG